MELILPDRAYYESYLDAIGEYALNHVAACPFLDAAAYDIFERINDYRFGVNLPLGYVSATYLWLVDDGNFIGEISIRHSLTDALLRYGGNIGYGVRFSEWNRGAGTKMLSLALAYAKKELGLKKVLITCDDDNIGSARVIEKNGGVLENRVKNTIDGAEVMMRRYWIDIA
ncbi:MAG: GNAT family N-acetyltransferase [Clostridiaceae bacterium]|nr:GNAT family N-acetyltransferase [Eubacteriales bacterium]